jgi:DHA1 family multidrug resistance protein-like MFS transporter
VSIAEEDAAGRLPGAAAAVRQGDPEGRAATLVIAAAVCATAMSFNVWYPFLPLYALDLGATSDANAIFWVAVAITVQGIARLASSAVWGYMSDRYGRKLMVLRAMYLSSITFAVAALASEPWHLSLALGCQGFFSGFIPASVALVSVSVPDSRLNRSLSMVTGAQYLGTTTGPALGAALALAVGYRGSIAVAAVVPLLAATLVLLRVPRDQVGGMSPARAQGAASQLEPFRPSAQFVLAVLTLFSLYCMLELVRLATPIALKALEGGGDVAGVAGLTFSLAGLASAISVLALAPWLFNRGRMRTGMAMFCGLGAFGCALLAASSSVPVYVAGFLLIAVVISSMVPAGNTLIAANVVRSRRGTGFGVAASVQALSFAIGPLAASFFAAVSLDLGFAVIAGLFLALGLVLLSAVREPPAG